MLAPARARWPRLFALAAGVFTACALGAVGQPPPEEEDPKGGVKKKVVVDDDPVIVKPKGPDAGPGSPPDVRLDELARAAEGTAHAALKALYQKNLYPHDRLTTKGGVARIKPIPLAARGGDRLPAAFGIQELGADGQVGEVQGVNLADVRRIDHFEELVLLDASALLNMKPLGTGNAPEVWAPFEQLGAAETLMGAGLRYHDYARERNIRKGRGWDEIRKPLADQLRGVRLEQLKLAVKEAEISADWSRVREAGSRLMQAYPKDAAVAADVASARVLEAKRLLASAKHFDHVRAKELLDEFEARYPGGGGDPVRALRADISRIASTAFQRAKDKKGVNDLTAARDALAQAAALDPTLQGLREMQRELKAGYQTLYVGVRQYPVNMSPVTARFDSEKQVVELIFDGLLAEVPDDGNGARYRPGAAVAMPAVVPGGREFQLRTQERGIAGPGGLDSQDVVGTIKLLQSRTDTWAAYTLPWFDELPQPKDNATVRVAFKLGHPDPRALCTFKLLPAQWMIANNKLIDDAGFAEKPTGTGPYRLHSNPKVDPGVAREMVFVDNPLYGRWRDRAKLPFIKEIRLVEVAKVHNLIESFQQGSLHILPEVPTADLDKFRAALGDKVQEYTAATNRRVHMLAVNHRRPHLQSKALRQGLSLAIDRESILNDVFRAGKKFHAGMGGPFPPRSWATPKATGGVPVPLVNRDLAFTKLKEYLGGMGAKAEIPLLYAKDDPQAEAACMKIKTQIEALLKDAGGAKFTIQLEPVLTTHELMERVEDEHRYDLAYVPFDYPDDWFPYALGAMLDPLAADRGGRNWTGFLANGTGADDRDASLGQLLTELRAFREFDQLAKRSAEVHKQFNASVPFVPLWQLDRHTLIHSAVKVYTEDSDAPVSPRVLNPTTLFQGIARWRLEG
ncbi:MAG: hypothetical protein FJ304_19420 [Planctomycetes bacterium]|nr:hypothetical protein [Planctomycetota bacterium]